ncbi:hypothetical protein BJ138DRAFT_998811, partial [Hygrophoropsis aurantiaca]
MQPTAGTLHRRSSTYTTSAPLTHLGYPVDLYSDSRKHGYQGPARNVRLHRATTNGGGTIAKSEDGVRCVVAGKELTHRLMRSALRILRLSDPSDTANAEHKSSVGRGGHKIDSSRNLWDGSGLKIDSASTDVAWCHGSFTFHSLTWCSAYNNKVLTSARNGDLIMWDLNKSGSTKYERKTKNHIRSIHKLSCSTIVHYYCVTGSADGDMRVWDLRDMSRSLMKIHHPTSVRSLVFSPCLSHPLQAIVGLDNGSIYRWDLQMGQRGQLDRLPVAHTGAILALDWCSSSHARFGSNSTNESNIGGGGGSTGTGDSDGERSWILSAGLDHTVKVWDLSTTSTSLGTAPHIAHKPMYTLHPSFPVRRVLWRPDYPCELAVVSNAEFGSGSGSEILASPRLSSASVNLSSDALSALGMSGSGNMNILSGAIKDSTKENRNTGGDAVEIWDVRRGWIAKWTVEAPVSEGGVTVDISFRDSHAMWAQHSSGTFSQIDLRNSAKPIDAIPRASLTWSIHGNGGNYEGNDEGSLAFVTDKGGRWEIPYDDVHPEKRHLMRERKVNVKTLGDASGIPGQQSLGTFAPTPKATDTGEDRDNHAFAMLARRYAIDCSDRINMCSVNAEAALEAGNVQAAQVWLLLESLLTDIVPEWMHPAISSPPTATQPIPLSHSISAPAAFPTIATIGVQTNPQRAMTTSSVPKTSSRPPSMRALSSESFPPPNSRNLTPASSASSSPRRTTIALPPSTTMTSTPRRPSILTAAVSTRRPSIYTRPSTLQNDSPIDSIRSGSQSLRHVGEGALDDDSDSSDGSMGGDESFRSPHSDEEGVTTREASLISPQLRAVSKLIPAHPSPLSRLAGQHQWTEDEDDRGKRARVEDEDEASPSPGSTDTESDSGGSEEISRTRSRRNSAAARMKTRSRSSTLVMLPAPAASTTLPRSPRSPSQTHHSVIKRASQSSIGTVVAGDASVRDQEVGGTREESRPWRVGHNQGTADTVQIRTRMEMSDNRREVVVSEEIQLRETGWRALRDIVDDCADKGDVQMCAMLSIVASKELQINSRRMLRFLESYIDILTRLRLHTCAAYLRKYTEPEDVRTISKLETVIYTTCGRCRKPITSTNKSKGAFTLCASCRTTVQCSICHLPVRTLLFQCSVCAHGGHQECYWQYYMTRPMVELGLPLANRGRTITREEDGEGNGDNAAHSVVSVWQKEAGIVGHPCAAGCGHFCWAAARREQGEI